MTRLSRLLMAVAASLLGALYVVPLWRIDLLAPQYPEGLGMFIRIDTVTGLKPNDLDNINGLNHYIGMRPIVADAIPELRWMPWIVAGLIAAGLLVAALGRRPLVLAWLASLGAFGALGLWRFWAWGYDYGHNLDLEHAIIKVPGMAYQPPLIGSKQLLNFTATSWPDWGALAAGVSVLLAIAAWWMPGRGRARGERPVAASISRLPHPVALVLVAALLGACARAGARPIAYDGTESCEFCRMAVTDARFGAELVTATGKVHTFDSVECLAGFHAEAERAGLVRAAYVTDSKRPGTLIPVGDAHFVRATGPGASPMGLGIRAFASEAEARAAGSPVLRWEHVVALVSRDAPAAEGAHAAH